MCSDSTGKGQWKFHVCDSLRPPPTRLSLWLILICILLYNKTVIISITLSWVLWVILEIIKSERWVGTPEFVASWSEMRGAWGPWICGWCLMWGLSYLRTMSLTLSLANSLKKALSRVLYKIQIWGDWALKLSLWTGGERRFCFCLRPFADYWRRSWVLIPSPSPPTTHPDLGSVLLFFLTQFGISESNFRPSRSPLMHN